MWNKWINWTERKICICHSFHSLCFHFHFQCPHTEFFYKDGYWTSLSSSKITLPIYFLWCSLRFIIFSYNFCVINFFFLGYLVGCQITSDSVIYIVLSLSLLIVYSACSNLFCTFFFLHLVHFHFVCTFKWQN